MTDTDAVILVQNAIVKEDLFGMRLVHLQDGLEAATAESAKHRAQPIRNRGEEFIKGSQIRSQRANTERMQRLLVLLVPYLMVETDTCSEKVSAVKERNKEEWAHDVAVPPEWGGGSCSNDTIVVEDCLPKPDNDTATLGSLSLLPRLGRRG